MTDGSPDDTFGDGGITVSDFTDFGCAQADLEAMAIQSDGKLIATGLTACKGVNDVELAFARHAMTTMEPSMHPSDKGARSRPWSGTPPASKGRPGSPSRQMRGSLLRVARCAAGRDTPSLPDPYLNA